MDFSKLASHFLGDKLKLDLNGDGVQDNLSDALSGLLGKVNEASGDIDLAGLVDKMKTSGGELQEMVSSWLGDGENAPITIEQINNFFSSNQISEFASKLGISIDEAKDALSETLPQIIDKASSGGSLLDKLDDGFFSNLLSNAKNLFNK